MKELEVEGKTVTLAVEKGLSDLGLRRDQVEVQIIQEAAPGFLGLGAKLAKVRIREKIWGDSDAVEPSSDKPAAKRAARSSSAPRPSRATQQEPPRRREAPASRPSIPQRERPSQSEAPGGGASRPSGRPQPSYAGSGPRHSRYSGGGESSRRSIVHEAPPDTAKACSETKLVLEELLKLLEISKASIKVSWDDAQARVLAEIETPEGQSLLDKGDKFIESLQFLVTLIASRRVTHPVAVQVETAGYWQQKEEEVLLQVHQAMEMVKRTSRPVRLKPMDAVMRRLVHRTLAKHPEIETASEGDGIWRKVVLRPRRR